MTDILCRWLNEEVRLDPKLSKCSSVVPVAGLQRGFSGLRLFCACCIQHRCMRFSTFPANSSFAEQFSNGFLFGEVLHKHGLQVRLTLVSNYSRKSAVIMYTKANVRLTGC